MTSPAAALSTESRDRLILSPSLFKVLVALSLLAAVVFVSLGITRSLWLDEAFSVNLAVQEPGSIIEGLKRDGHPPLYFLLLAGWIRIFGDSEIAVRSLSGLFYLAAVTGIYTLALTVLRDRQAAMVTAVLYLASKTAVAHAQNARMYALLGCLVVLSTLFYYRAFVQPNPRRRDAVFYSVCVLLGTFTHFWFCFTVLAQAVGWLLFGQRKRFSTYLVTTTAAVLPFVAVWLPIFFNHQIYNGVVDWMDQRSFGLGTLANTFADYYGEGALGAVAWAGILILLLVPLRNGRLALPDRQRLAALGNHLRTPPVALFATLLAASLLAPLLVSQARPIYRIGSYTIIGLPPLVIVLGALFHRFADRRGLALFLIALLGGSMLVFGWLRTRPVQGSDRIATAYLLDHHRDGDRIIFTSLSRSAIEYYLRRQAPEETLERLSFPAEIDEHPGWRSPPDQLSRLALLDAEAERIDQGLRQDVKPGERIWMFYGVDTGISNLLKDRLEDWLVLSDQLDWQSGFYTSILIYERPPTD